MAQNDKQNGKTPIGARRPDRRSAHIVGRVAPPPTGGAGLRT
jgi:hypothetical protein